MPGRPTASRPKRPLWLVTLRITTLFLLPLALAAGMLITIAQFESGSYALWRIGTRVLPDSVSGTYVSGTLANGLHLRNVMVRIGETQIDIDDIEGRWRLDRNPFKLSVQHLRAGTVNIRLSTTASAKTPLPQNLRIPLALALNAITVDKLTVRQGLSTYEFGELSVHGESDRIQHTLVVEHLNTPYGKASANLRLNGAEPFAISGEAAMAGAYERDRYRLDVRLSGTLPALDVDVHASGDKLSGQAIIKATPFAAVPFQQIALSATHVNPKAFSANAPQADLTLHADLAPVAAAPSLVPTSPAKSMPATALPFPTVNGQITLTNAQPGTLDADRLPLISASAEVRLDSRRQQLTRLQLKLPNQATLDGHGELLQADNANADRVGEFQFNVAALDLHALHTTLKATALRGPLTVKLQRDHQQVLLTLEEPRLKIELDALIDANKYTLRTAQFSAGAARMALSGTIARDAQVSYTLQGKLSEFDPALWIDTAARGKSPPTKPTKPATPPRRNSLANASGKFNPAGSGVPRTNQIHGRINMDFNIGGSVAPELEAVLKFGLHDSEYDKLPMTGAGRIRFAGKRLLPSELQLSVAGNELFLNGGFGTPADRLAVKLNAPRLDRLGVGLAGLLQLDGQLSGTLARPNAHASYRAEHLVFGAYRLGGLTGQADIQGDLASEVNALSNTRLSVSLAAQDFVGPDMTLDNTRVELAGIYGNHTFNLHTEGRLRGKPLALSIAAHGKLAQSQGNTYWDGTIDKLENRGLPQFAVTSPFTLSASAGRVALGAMRFTLAGATVDLKNFSYDRGWISSEGSADALNIGNLLALQQEFTGVTPPLKADLVLDARWKFATTDRAEGFAEGFAEIARRSGDLMIDTGRGETALGLSELRLRAAVHMNQVTFDAQAVAARIGNLTAHAQTSLKSENGRLNANADLPFSAQVDLTVPHLKTVGALFGPQIVLDGSIAANLSASGTLAKPKFSGSINGDKLALTLFDQGIQLRDGIARLALSENVIALQQLEFHGGDGTLKASGQVQVGQSNPDLSARIVADRLQLFSSPDRQLVLSGQASLASIAEKLHIDGKFKIDRALFDFPKSSAPRLGDDVVIVRRNGKVESAPAASEQDKMAKSSEKPAGRFAPVVDVNLDLGDDFRFRGTGADLRLGGSIAVHSEPYQALRATGTVQVTAGTYEVFGRKLAIERGLLNFQGPIDNPNINILAMRRNQEVEAGVEVTGVARQPRVKLVSEPDVMDEEKLSWLMFGHGSDSSGLGQQQAASAALGLLGNVGTKRLAQGIGLDTFSVGSSESGLNDQQVVNLGKAISEKFYLGYEQSLTGAASIAKVTWQMSRRWSMIVRAGAINGVDVLFSWRYD
jgi:translocation and assembly module TamB